MKSESLLSPHERHGRAIGAQPSRFAYTPQRRINWPMIVAFAACAVSATLVVYVAHVVAFTL